MNIHMEFYKPEEGQPEFPLVLHNLRKYAGAQLGKDMQVYGIESIELSYDPVGLVNVSSPRFAALKLPAGAEPPAEVKAGRKRKIRLLADDMLFYGILSIEISLSDEDCDKVLESWRVLTMRPQEHVAEQEQQAEAPPVKIELNIDQDPTNGPAL